jgi:pimeloyl-ACP methyl ester carboxylesterase
MAVFSESYVQAHGLTIHFYCTGGDNKPAIILLHGVMDNGLGWISVARDLQGRFNVIMTDARGHGQTGGSMEGFSHALLADDVAAFIRALEMEKLYLFGHSMGAMTAAMVAANYPELERVVAWREILPRINCPILLVTGDPKAHAIVTPQIAQEASRLWQQGEVIQIPGAGHCVHRDRYAEAVPQIQAFLSRV